VRISCLEIHFELQVLIHFWFGVGGVSDFEGNFWKTSMILIRLLSSPVRAGYSAVPSGVRTERLSEKFHFTTAYLFACFGFGLSATGLTQLSHYRNTHKIEWIITDVSVFTPPTPTNNGTQEWAHTIHSQGTSQMDNGMNQSESRSG